MRKVLLVLLGVFLITSIQAQSIAFLKMGTTYDAGSYLDDAMLAALVKSGLNAKPFSNYQLFTAYRNSLTNLSPSQQENLKMFGHDFIILHKSELSDQGYSSISHYETSLNSKKNWQSDFLVFNVKTNQHIDISLAISTYDCGDTLESCSNINGFAKEVKEFVQGNVPIINESPQVVLTNPAKKQPTNASENNKSKIKSGGSGKSELKLKVVRVKERNQANSYPVSIDIYDKSLSLKVGDNIIITRTDEVKIPGTRKTTKAEIQLGKARIIDDFNKPLYTAKLIGTAGVNLQSYADGDLNYNAMLGEAQKAIVSVPKVMVIPEKLGINKLVNGVYELSKEEVLLIGAIKNKLENNGYTTIGFETALKRLMEESILNDNTQEDLKSLVLESSGADFYVEFKSVYDSKTVTNLTVLNIPDGKKVRQTTELIGGKCKWVSDNGYVYKQLNKSEAKEKYWSSLDDVIYLHDESRNMILAIHANGDYYKLDLGQGAEYKKLGNATLSMAATLPCVQNFNLKIRNYATSEDVATDIAQLNTCGTPEDYKSFAESILNAGALKKINLEFQNILNNGKKISVHFTILNGAEVSFDKMYNELRLEEHIQNAIQSYSITYRQNGVVNKRMSFSEVYIPSLNDNTGQGYYPNDFALSVIKYLKDVVGIDCEKSVIGQNVNFNIK
jgi:hypothetical protein